MLIRHNFNPEPRRLVFQVLSEEEIQNQVSGTTGSTQFDVETPTIFEGGPVATAEPTVLEASVEATEESGAVQRTDEFGRTFETDPTRPGTEILVTDPTFGESTASLNARVEADRLAGSQFLAERPLTALQKDAQDQIKAGMIALQERTEKVTREKTAEAFRTTEFKRGQLPGAGRPQSSVFAPQIEAAKKAGSLFVERALASDPGRRSLIAKISNQQNRVIQLRDKIRTTGQERAFASELKKLEKLQEEQKIRDGGRTKEFTDLLSKFPEGALAATPKADFLTFAEQEGANLTVAGAFHDAAILEAQAKETKDEAEAEKLNATAAKLRAEAARAGLTNAEKDFDTLRFLQESGADQSLVDAFSARAGFTAKPLTALQQAQANSTQATADLKNAQLAELASDTDTTGQRFPSLVTGDGNAGVVTQDFGATSPVTSDNRELKLMDGSKKIGTPGLDLDGRIGDPVLAAIAGKVVDASKLLSKDDQIGLGTTVAVQDAAGNVHFFNHMSTADVSIGDNITKGQALGGIGNTGNVIAGEGGDGSHLDYRVKDPAGDWVDPRQFIDEFEIQAKGKAIGLSNKQSQNLIKANLVPPDSFEDLSEVEQIIADNDLNTDNGINNVATFFINSFIQFGDTSPQSAQEFADALVGIGIPNVSVENSLNALNANLGTTYTFDGKTGRVSAIVEPGT